MKTFIQFLKEAVATRRKPSYYEIGHGVLAPHELKGKWKHPHIELHSKALGGKMHKTPYSSTHHTHEDWGKSQKHKKDEKVHSEGRIDHKNKRVSAVVYIPSTKKTPHPKVIEKAFNDVHKHMEKNHPDYVLHEYGEHYY